MDYTKGPWISEEAMHGRPPDAGCGVIASDDDVIISNPSRGIIAWATRSVRRTNAETLANARLIAAAPDLLEAAKEMLSALATRDIPSFMWSSPRSQALCAAIEKAEGSRWR